MDLRTENQRFELIQTGRTVPEKSAGPCLEAFSGNALYSWRGMSTMNQYKTVKEVCDLTGLTRKHLYYFHHEGVVRAVAYANYSVEGYDGYKLYDDNAVEKLQQISLCYQIGLKRDEIKEIMLRPDSDSNQVLHTLLTLEREKKCHIERHIAALEYLILVGTKNGSSGSLRGIQLDDLGRILLDIRAASDEAPSVHSISRERAERFAKEFSRLLSELAQIEDITSNSSAGDPVIQKILELSNTYLGADSLPFILGLFMRVLGEGSLAEGITEQLTPAHGRAMIQYMIDHPQFIRPTTHTSNGGDRG